MEVLAAYAGVPVYNGPADGWHPTQMLADFLTMHASSHRAFDSIAYAGWATPTAMSAVATRDGRRRPDLRPARALALVGRAGPRRREGSSIGSAVDTDRRP
ncbi:MAG: hypothetical protein JO325_16430 [Solirubrobacterales bacterium]|nr:hypothetical protein [Solirubrobacterales bacterium]